MQIKSYFEYYPEHKGLYQEILKMINPICEMYPKYSQWFEKTFLAGLKKGERSYIVAFDNNQKPVGCLLMKNTAEEKKICTLFVHPDFRKQGIASELMKDAVNKLGEHPLISVSGRNVEQLRPLLAKFGFHLSAVRKGMYGRKDAEYYFNDKKADLIKNRLIPVLTKYMECKRIR